MSLVPLYVLLGEVSVQVICPNFIWVACLLEWSRVSSLCILEIKPLSEVANIIGKYVFPYSWFSFHFNTVLFSCAEAFYIDEIPLVYSFLYVPFSRGYISENIAAWYI